MMENCNGNKTNTIELYKNCKSLDAILNRRLASSTHEQTERHAVPGLYAWICIGEELKPNAKTIKVLLGSGASTTFLRGSLIKKIWRTKTSAMQWRTCGRNFHIEYCSKVQLYLPEFSD